MNGKPISTDNNYTLKLNDQNELELIQTQSQKNHGKDLQVDDGRAWQAIGTKQGGVYTITDGKQHDDKPGARSTRPYMPHYENGSLPTDSQN